MRGSSLASRWRTGGERIGHDLATPAHPLDETFFGQTVELTVAVRPRARFAAVVLAIRPSRAAGAAVARPMVRDLAGAPTLMSCIKKSRLNSTAVKFKTHS